MLHSLLSCMALPSPGTPPAQLKQRQWGDSISRFKAGRKINHSGWAFVPICHGAAITIPFSTLFVFKLKRLDVTGNLTSSAGCLCSSITIILQIWNDTIDMLSFRKMELRDPLVQRLATCHLRNKHVRVQCVYNQIELEINYLPFQTVH